MRDTISAEAAIAAIMSNFIPIVGSSGVSDGMGGAVGGMGGVGVGVGVGVGAFGASAVGAGAVGVTSRVLFSLVIAIREKHFVSA